MAILQLAQLAPTRVPAALSATGGDDLFAGYYRRRAPGMVEASRIVRRALGRQLLRHVPARRAKRSSELAAQLHAVFEAGRRAEWGTVRRGNRPLREAAQQQLPPGVEAGPQPEFALPLVELFPGPWRCDGDDWFAGLERDFVHGWDAAGLVRHQRPFSDDLSTLVAPKVCAERLGQARSIRSSSPACT